MRFGHNLHQHVIPEWHRHYVDYNLLKWLAKPPLDGVKVYDELQASLDRVEAFVELRLLVVDTANNELCKLFGLDPESRSIPDAAQVCPYELTLLLEAFHEFRHDLRRLAWFQRVNGEAVDRILGKLERREQTLKPFHVESRARWEDIRTAWDRCLARRLLKCGSLITDASGGLKDPHRTAGKSLYLARCRREAQRTGLGTDEVTKAVQRGDFRHAMELLDAKRTYKYAVHDGTLDTVQVLYSDLLRYAVMLRPAQARTWVLLDQSLDFGLVLQHEVFKWAILAMGRRKKLDSSQEQVPHRQHHAAPGFQYVQDIVKFCKEDQVLEALAKRDRVGRIPVHYAAMYGVIPLRVLISAPSVSEGNRYHSEPMPLQCRDIEGLTPVHHAVMSNHPVTVAEMAYILRDEDDESPGDAGVIARELLPLALMNEMASPGSRRLGQLPVLEAIVASGKASLSILPVIATEAKGITSVLMDWLSTDSSPTRQDWLVAGDKGASDLEVADRRGWTALFHACALGQYDVAKRLLELGCSQTMTDDRGWTAQEYAALNGHLAVANLFEPCGTPDMTDGPALFPRKEVDCPKLHCVEGERVIVASLGSERLNDVVTEVDLPYCSSPYAAGTYDGFPYALEVSAPGSKAQARIVRLPLLDDQINDPFVFPIPATIAPQLVFKVVRQESGTDKHEFEVGSGTALLEGNIKQFGAGRQSIIREQTIPVLDKTTMAAVGTVTFTYMVANHFAHLQAPRNVTLARKSADPPALIGHRGLGMNLKTQKYLQMGENTVESFLSAAKLGASLVEFDVQVTKDREAVIFHDFSLSQSGTDVPIHDVTLDQFKYAGNIQSPHGNPLSVLGPFHARDDPRARRRRARSVGGHFEAGAVQIRDRMKHTADYELKGFKPNTRGDFIQDSFATLEELLLKVPEHVGFDIEIKYPRLHEATAAGVAPVAIELNAFVDVALQVIHRHAGSRPVVLSSFTPEICILLSLKQRAYPVFFITNAGGAPRFDFERRAATVQVAVRFARRWNLAGVVFGCEALLLAPRLVGYVKSRGLLCATYGTPNNMSDNVRRQAESGVDVVIADRVRLVAETLAQTSVPN